MKEDGTFENRKLFAFVNSGAPDGKASFPIYISNQKHVTDLDILEKVSTATPGATSMLAAVMVFRFGIHLVSSSGRSTSEPLRRISTSLERVEWSSALRQTFTTQHLRRQATMSIVRCEQAASFVAVNLIDIFK